MQLKKNIISEKKRKCVSVSELHCSVNKTGKKKSIAKVRHVSCQRPLHRKQADEKRFHWLQRGSVMQLSVYIKAHYI